MSSDSLSGVKACVFDAYGTLFDVNAAAQHCSEKLGDKWQALAEIWRLKQLQYTWLRGLMGHHISFWQVTQDGLDYAMASLDIDDEKLRQQLLDLYFELDAFPEVKEMLTRLKDAGLGTAILSNGHPDMLQAAIDNAGIGNLLDACLSVEDVEVFKPHPSVYALPEKFFSLTAGEMSFQSSNGWDAHAAKAYGYQVVWINRYDQAEERIPDAPDLQLKTLENLPQVLEIT